MGSFTFLSSTLLSFVVGISLIAAIHELGHLTMAKMFGIRVKRYMVFFPPTLWQWRWGETTYGIGSVPLGGFVEIEGMGQDPTEDVDEIPAWDFRTKPAWQRALVMVGGIVFNLVSAYAIILGVLLATGKPYLPKEELNAHGIDPTPLGVSVGFVRGDKIVQVNGRDFVRADELEEAWQGSPQPTYTVRRGSRTVEVKVSDAVQRELQAEQGALWSVLIPYEVGNVARGSAAEEVGLAIGDRIVSINGRATPYLQDLKEALAAYQGAHIVIVYERAGQRHRAEVMLPEEGPLGIGITPKLTMRYAPYRVSEALGAARRNVARTLLLQLKGLANIVTGKVSWRTSLQSPVAIATMFGAYEGLTGFLWLVAFLSIILALMNLLPLPALDGFHLLVNLGEVVTGRKLPFVWYMRIQTVGVFLLGGGTLLLVCKDLWRLFGSG